MGAYNKITKKRFQAVLNKSGGMVTSLAQSLNVTRQTVYTFLKKNPDMKALLEDETNYLLDVAESHIHQKIMKGDIKSCWQYLDRKGKSRGYGNTITVEEPTVKNEDPLRAMIEKVAKQKKKNNKVK